MRRPYCFRRNKQLWGQAKKVIPDGSQGTRQPVFKEFPVFFERAKGCRMWDVDGNEFIDFLCSIGPIILGYAYDRVDNAVRAVMKTSFQSSMNHPIMLDLARELIDMIPCAERVRFFKTGTEATQAAVRLARHATGRLWVARHGYHGWADMFWHGRKEGIPEEAWKIIPPFDGTPDGLERVLADHKEPFAAVILCPADTKPFTKENYQGIVDVAHRHGAIVIFDEVKSGFRTALGGAQEVLGVTPDLTTVSKGMGNGYPIAALVGKAEVMEKIGGTPIAGTFSTEALSITASLATLRELREKNVPEHLWRMGQRLIDGLNGICERLGMEDAKAFPDPVPSMPRFKWKPYDNDGDLSHPAHNVFYSWCIRYGLFLSNWHVNFINFSHKEKDIDEALNIAEDAMKKTIRQLRA